MKKRLVFFLLSAIGLLAARPSHSQEGLFEGLFDKEKPAFKATILPADEAGAARLAVYFSHSKASALEASFWLKDNGASLLASGEKQLIRGLREMGNRQQDTLLIRGLTDGHFYTIGVDYRNPSSLSRKFTSEVLAEGYRYVLPAQSQEADRPQPPAGALAEPTLPAGPAPCRNPNLFVRIGNGSYCGAENRPAVLIECDNCQGMDWDFSVELRSEGRYWQPLRADGRRQAAEGTALRTEPLCLLPPGTYQLRVLAWGDGCPNPVIHNVSTPLTIPGAGADSPSQPVAGQQPTKEAATNAMTLPDSCAITGWANLSGDLLTGALELAEGSSCAEWNPVAQVTYIHPGHRDIELKELPLYPGRRVPFSIPLSQADLSRGIHTIQVVVSGYSAALPKPVPMHSFWIRAEKGEEDALAMGTAPDPAAGFGTGRLGGDVGAKGAGGCDQIEGLKLVYSPTQPNVPLYISWESPECCQLDGCDYAIWAGKGPGQMQLVVRGTKAGPSVTEVLPEPDGEQYFYEVVVNTAGGVRKAAFIPGEGPKYEASEIEAYYASLAPADGGDMETTASLDDGLAGRFGNDYAKPELPVSKFRPCRIFRETHIIANKPIQEGEPMAIEYDFHDKDYRFTLYHLPDGGKDWVLAPGTSELQDRPVFNLQAQAAYSGKYVIMAYKPDKAWGCLSAPLDEAVEINVMR